MSINEDAKPNLQLWPGLLLFIIIILAIRVIVSINPRGYQDISCTHIIPRESAPTPYNYFK